MQVSAFLHSGMYLGRYRAQPYLNEALCVCVCVCVCVCDLYFLATDVLSFNKLLNILQTGESSLPFFFIIIISSIKILG